MPSINVDLDYRTHPKTRRLVRALGKGAELIPIWLWCYCGKYHAKTGTISGLTAEQLEDELGWWGAAGKCVEALEPDFLTPVPGGWEVHDFIDRNGHIHAYHERAKKARAAQISRIQGNEDHANANGNTPATSRATSPALAPHCKEIQPPLPPKGGEGFFLDRPQIRERWDVWLSLRRKRFRRGEAEACVSFLEALGGEPAAVACLQDAIDNGLVQLRKPKPQATAEPITLRLIRVQKEQQQKRDEDEKMRVEFAQLPTMRELFAARQKATTNGNGNGVHHP